ncbi:unnamed protein product [Effrenium voratum]|uniref:Uncharacterized protein n=1 Tax=Effrenium voratum TaxID=2562239 RepID=A0AA36N7R9_9DINO|nr:unnamed protein product [Effrenium voratum]
MNSEEAKAYNGMKLGQAAGRKAASRAVALAKETCDSKIEARRCVFFEDGHTEQSLQSFVQSLDPSQMAILRQMLENSKDRGKG